MGKEYTKAKRRNLLLIWLVAVMVALVCLVVPEYFTLIKENREKAYKASSVLIHEVEQIIQTNDLERGSLDEFLRNTYTNKAKVAAVIIDQIDYTVESQAEFLKLASLLDVDEISVFDENGTIYMGTHPEYIGLSFDMGEQISYFKPMLDDRNLTMCQVFTENTYYGKRMINSMCWNKTKTRMIQVGSSQNSLPDILYESSESKNIITRIPTAVGTEIILADMSTDMIISATDSKNIGKKLADLGIELESNDYSIQKNYKTGLKENPIYCSIKDFNEYRIIVAQYQKIINADVPFTVMTFAEYLILVFIVVSFILVFMYNKLLEEESWALRDPLTDLFNRRGYENTLAYYCKNQMENNLTFISMDVNGLKMVNDHYGHAAGDKLLQGTAECIQKNFGSYGKVFRCGGDEFSAIIHSDDNRLEKIKKYFEESLEKWSQENNIPLHVSLGIVKAKDYPHEDIYILANIADQKMYQAKAAYYSAKGNNRRTEFDDDKSKQGSNTEGIKKNGEFLTY